MRLGLLLGSVMLLLAAPAGAYRDGEPENFSEQLVRAALERTRHEVTYDGRYLAIAYPNGDVPGGVGVGIVVDRRSPDGKRPLIVHNIGRGPKLEDMLFGHPITGHYRYYGSLPQLRD